MLEVKIFKELKEKKLLDDAFTGLSLDELLDVLREFYRRFLYVQYKARSKESGLKAGWLVKSKLSECAADLLGVIETIELIISDDTTPDNRNWVFT